MCLDTFSFVAWHWWINAARRLDYNGSGRALALAQICLLPANSGRRAALVAVKLWRRGDRRGVLRWQVYMGDQTMGYGV